jgi:hypothetical protein
VASRINHLNCGVAVRTGPSRLLRCGDAASAFHPTSDFHNNDKSRYVGRILPKEVISRFLGRRVPRLRRLVEAYRERARMTSGHDLYSSAVFTHQWPDEAVRKAART